jgi:hypothetical protein
VGLAAVNERGWREMADRRNARVQIGQMNLRLPGGSVDSAHSVAEGVGRRLGEMLPSGLERRVGALNVRVQIPGKATEAEMSDAIARSIAGALRKGRSRGNGSAR